MACDNREKADNRPWTNLPAAWQNKVSMRWLTLEALRVLQQRVANQSPVRVLLWTTAGCVEGELADIVEHYDESRSTDDPGDTDVASAVVHLRYDLWNLYAEKNPELQAVDSAALIHVRNATVRIGARRLRIPHMAVFAQDVVGFTLTGLPVL
jgi:hypothetical protein